VAMITFCSRIMATSWISASTCCKYRSRKCDGK